MNLDEQIEFCKEKTKNIKLRTEPQTFADITESLEKLKKYENLDFLKSEQARNKAIDDFMLALCKRKDRENSVLDEDSIPKVPVHCKAEFCEGDCDKCVAEIMSVAEQMKKGEPHD